MEPTGLDAFATEAAPSGTASTPDGAPPQSSAVSSPRLTVLLALLVVLQAVPSTLWVRQRLSQGAAAVASAAAPPVAAAAAPLPPPVAVAAPCEAAATASGAVGAGGTTGRAAPVATASPAAAASVAAAKTLVAGMVSVTAPVTLRVFSNGRFVGTTEAETIMLPVGTHQLEFVNESVGYRARQSVTVQAARTSSVRLEPPPGALHVNAVPWAEVWVDNRRIGETPIGNLAVPVGQREVVFRHPELGERRATVLVTLSEPARVSMDLRKK
jgi:hypothetical protein